MPITIICARCKKPETVGDNLAGKAVRCAQCRYLNAVPAAPAASTFDGPVPQPLTEEELRAAAEMEQEATQSEMLIVVRKRRNWFGRPVAPGDPATGRRRVSNLSLILMATIPLLLAALLLFFLVPWSSIFHPAGPPAPPAPAPTEGP
jgi:hypothetical protein